MLISERGITAQTFAPGISGERRFGARCANLLQTPGASAMKPRLSPNMPRQCRKSADWDSPLEIRSAILSELNDTHLLPACWAHGDFAPWNMKQQPGRELMLIDWEDARRGGLPLQDYFHFLHVQDYLFDQRPHNVFRCRGGVRQNHRRHANPMPQTRDCLSRRLLREMQRTERSRSC